ncbi:hypothetical protein [Sphingobium sp. YG1]|nr:hypothetical protein [Sphingobium sp. YG1]BBD01862.1 hypothetical protein YGS_C1P3117 [Sphingobium sp. YG1]
MPYSDFSPEQQAAMDRSLEAEVNAFLYMLVSIAALVGSIALVSWAIWA